jgi:hypothetical protein
MSAIYDELLDYTRKLKVIDTHEHLPTFEHLRNPDMDLLSEYLRQYFNRDIHSAGMSASDIQIVRDPSKPLLQRWQLVQPYWNLAKNTGYGRALKHTLNILYGIQELNDRTIEEANAKFRTLYTSGNHLRHVLKDVCNIERIVLHQATCHVDREFYVPVFHVNEWVRPNTIEEMVAATEKQGLRLHRLEDFVEAFRLTLTKAKDSGACAIKCTLAYLRTLYFERPTYAQAEEAFTNMMRYQGMKTFAGRPVPDGVFVDYMMHTACRLAGELQLPIQIHTGLLETFGGMLENSNPLLLNNLFYEYPETKFDIFHIGYPWHLQIGALAKMFQNVYIDMCWAHIISPNASITALHEYLDAVPSNKIMAFGGDHSFVDAVAGHLQMAKENICIVLEHKISRGIFDLDEAKILINQMFYHNPKNLFGLDKHISSTS